MVIMKRVIGFTLIELLIVIVMVAILASIAYPSYQSHLIKARRGDVKTALLKAQLKQSSLHILSPSYSDVEADLGLINTTYYTFEVTEATNSTFIIEAEAVKGETQENDTGCTTLTINQYSDKTPITCW